MQSHKCMSIGNKYVLSETMLNSVWCRFQKLREIIPNSDQKRDKASFLLEVNEDHKIKYPT